MLADEIVGIQGPGWIVPDFEENLKLPERMAVLVDIARQMEKDPQLSPHMLAFAHRPGSNPANKVRQGVKFFQCLNPD